MIRITGGEFRGRALLTPAHDRTRPTLSKLRQALFNSLQTTVPGARVLDLFAGSGALGFEALSRGAAEAYFVEKSGSVAKLIHKNASELNVERQVQIFCEDLTQAWHRIRPHSPFDLVLADPPYSEGWEQRIFRALPWERMLKPGGFFCLEWGSLEAKVPPLDRPFPFLVKTRERTYGDTVLTTYYRDTDYRDTEGSLE